WWRFYRDSTARCRSARGTYKSPMHAPLAKRSLRRTALQIALAAATIATAGRLIQLAASVPPPLKGGARGGTVTTLDSPKSDTANPDLAALYASCPMAAVIDLKTVTTDPQKVDALLPAYRPTAHRVSTTPI